MEIINRERLIECRLNLGITKQEAARRIRVSQPAYLRYESGTRNPSIQIISKMAEVFSTSVDYLIGKSTESHPDRIIIERRKSPALFVLVETCKDLDVDQVNRILTYSQKLSASKHD